MSRIPEKKEKKSNGRIMKAKNILTEEIRTISPNRYVNKDKEFVVSIPHGGLWVPASMQEMYSIGKDMLIGSDIYTQELYNIPMGDTLTANLNIYVVNMSRRKRPKKDAPIHLRADPLHTAPLTEEAILLAEPSTEEKNMLMEIYNHYHKTLDAMLESMRVDKGYALLFDCHSMNSRGLMNTPDKGLERPDIIIGDCHGTSADGRVTEALYETFNKTGLEVTINNPYAGGHITQKHGRNESNHAVQIEIKRSLYMHEGLDGEPIRMKSEALAELNQVITKAYSRASARLKK